MYLSTGAGTQRQQGSALFIAVFVIVVMSSLALVLLNNLRQEDSNLGLDVNQTRALAVANTGVEWALARVLNRNASESPAAACSNVEAKALAAGNGLVGDGFVNCTATPISCNASDAAPGDAAATRFLISVEGNCGSGAATAKEVIEVLAYD
ncbi:hypothetical protein [Ferrimonas lipolytica]|uniref:MSHA biogenesis protein MshP n=1 Tax=Ferrimonas lipolytica TaxID=2724191 RepID=A0A6H1UHX3_9GAMM|nr:hypothetical protein [Ferrimonas lipolytica]QIZ77913.1 hypothetical protein HER31_14025 [Ferrimonas lipolytica]